MNSLEVVNIEYNIISLHYCCGIETPSCSVSIKNNKNNKSYFYFKAKVVTFILKPKLRRQKQCVNKSSYSFANSKSGFA